MHKVCSNKCQFYTYEHRPIFKAGLSSSYDGWEKCKEKVPDVSDPNQNVETKCYSNIKFTQLKRFIHQKGAEKLAKGECMYVYIYIFIYIYIYILYIYTYIYVAGYIATNLANTAVVNIRILSRRYHFRFLVFASIGECISY